MLHDTLLVKLRYEAIIKNILANDSSTNPKRVQDIIKQTKLPEHHEL